MVRDSKYLNLIRTLPCIKCGINHGIQAAHLRKNTDGGMGLKPSDCYAFPMCDKCHSSQHTRGEVTFWGGIEKVWDAKDWSLLMYAEKDDFWKFRRVFNEARKDLFL